LAIEAVMIQRGKWIGEGQAIGMEDSLPRIEAAGSALSDAPLEAGRGLRRDAQQSQGGAPTINIENLNAIDPAQALAEALREDLAR
jgi:hypothetical protein